MIMIMLRIVINDNGDDYANDCDKNLIMAMIMIIINDCEKDNDNDNANDVDRNLTGRDSEYC